MSRRGLIIQGAPGFPSGTVVDIRECAENLRLINPATRQTLDIGVSTLKEWVYEGVEGISPGSVWESNIELGTKVEVLWERKATVSYQEGNTRKELPIGSFLSTFKPIIEEVRLDAEELQLYISNDGDLYRRHFTPIAKNLSKKWKKGGYNTQAAVKAWMYLVDAGAQKYAKEFKLQQKWNDAFPKAMRLKVAEMFRDDFEAEAEIGNFYEGLEPLSE